MAASGGAGEGLDVLDLAAKSHNTELLAHIDCPGGGQVWVDGTTLFVGHMRHPSGTTIVDVADPRKPKVLTRIEMPQGWHSHKVRVADGIMIVNHERLGDSGDPEFGGGLAIYDVAKPAEPRLISKWRTHGKGVHRYDFDGRYAYISPTCEGYIGNIMMILDLADPSRPTEVGRWWIPGQWAAGGEEYPWENWWRRAATIRCASVTGSTSAIGTTDSTFSTSRICRGRPRSPD